MQALGLHKNRLTCIFVLRVTFREGGTLAWGFAFLRVPLIENIVPKCQSFGTGEMRTHDLIHHLSSGM